MNRSSRLWVLVWSGLALTSSLQTVFSQVFITEIMPDNVRTLADEDGQFSDWIEIYNPAVTSVNLLGWHLTDDPALLSKWTFPNVSIAAGEFLVVFASGKDRTVDPARLHTNFQLDNNGEYLALVRPDGVTIESGFVPSFPPVKEDVSYGLSTRVISSQLLSNSAPAILVPASGTEWPANWHTPGFTPDASWFIGFAPPALGFDTNQPPPVAVNVAPGGTALQSTTAGGHTANLAINGVLSDTTETLNTDNAPFWQVRLASEAALDRIVLHNRTACCGSRLRDITIEILNHDGTLTNFVSALLNPENDGFTFPAGPSMIAMDLVAATGSIVPGQIVRVRRTPDPDLSGSGGQGGSEEISVLSLGEVQVFGTPLGTDFLEVNLARTGSPAPTAVQSTTQGSFTAGVAINGNLGDFSHTTAADPNPTWTLNLGREAVIQSITLHNRDSCCGSRLRDITLEVRDAANNLVYASPLLNPENAGYAFPNGPDNLLINLNASPIIGQRIVVRRTPDPDLSGTGGQGNADEGAVLSLGEVIVLGYDLSGLLPFIRTELESRMLGINASAFVRIPFQVDQPSELASLDLNVRYDDGLVVYLNGMEVARRNAPALLEWNSAATAGRGLAESIRPDMMDLDAWLGQLSPGPNTLAIQGLNVASTDGDFLIQPELVSTHLDITPDVYLVNATPGSQNQSDYYFDEVADTQFSQDRGFFTQPFSLEISTPTTGAAIYFSLDCSEPGPGQGFLYTGAIPITNTTVVRARAFREGWKATDIDTHTYIFPDDVIYQAPNWPVNRVPPPNFPATWGANAVDYGMDPNVVSQFTLEEWREALSQIPSLSVVTEMKNLFDATTGIYANALQHGIDWERPASLELMDSRQAQHGQFQENCGLRIRGGFSRNTQFVKHSFRVFFRREYGAPKLIYPLFEDEGAGEFDTFDIRTSQNYSWPREASYNNGRHDTMIREVWCRETLGAMGQPYRRSRYYHLYLNGQYWGLFETDERPEASFGSTYLGGTKEDFDVVKCANHVGEFVTEVTDGNAESFSNLWSMARSLAGNPSDANYFKILGRNADGSRNPAFPVMLEVDNLIDYMLGIFFSGDGDATLSNFLSNNRPNNWFGMKNRNNPDQGFVFVNSDAEHTLGAPSSQPDRTGPFPHANQNLFTYANPQWIHEDLMRNLEYRVRFGDRVQKHFFNGGALTFEACTNRWWRKAVQITKAVRAYSARWGDAVREPPYNESDWQFMVQFVATNFFPTRGGIVLNQLRTDNLYPAVDAPSFNNYGGFLSPGDMLTMSQTDPNGTIFFTTDGTDPRMLGGAVSPNAQPYAVPLSISGNTVVQARVRVGAQWSALVVASFTTAEYFRNLAVTEIMYHPPGTPVVDGDEFEFLELKNTGNSPLDLSGLSFTSGITFAFTNGTRLPGLSHFVLVRNPVQFQARYPGVPHHAVYIGGLNNGGETVRLAHFIGGPVLSITYADTVPWPLAADGHGFSAVPAHPEENLNSDNGIHWRPSTLPGGSPNADDPAPTIPAIVINEALSHTATGLDYIELHNPTGADVNVGGWFLTDDAGVPKKFRIPSNTMIAAGEHLVFSESDFNPTPGLGNSFTLNAQGDDVYLFSGDSQTNLTGYSHGFDFGAAPEGISFGRYVISTGEAQFPPQTAQSPGAANAGPIIGPVVLSEIHYHPADGQAAFVELRNISDQPVGLFDPLDTTNTWRLDGLAFSFPPMVTLPAGGLALVVETDPTLFRTAHAVPAEVPIFGPYPGTLQNSGERLQLQRPDPRGVDSFAFVTVDDVRYNDRLPWPQAADGSGPSLQKPDTGDYGNDPIAWVAAIPTPGGATQSGTAPTITEHPADRTIVAYKSVSFEATATGSAPLLLQWRFQESPILGATQTQLTLSDVQPSQAGLYDLVAYNNAGSAVSLPAKLTVLIPARITSQPVNQTVYEGSNATLVVMATSASPISYQWRFNGSILPGETSAQLFLPSVTREMDGFYDVILTDSVGDITSQPARLEVWVTPEVVHLATSYDVIQGGHVMLSVQTDGTLPMTYRWRRRFTTLKTESLNSHTSFYVVSNVQPNIAGSSNAYTIILTNAAFFTPGLITENIFLNILADDDGDGIPTAWEELFQLEPGMTDDAVLDPDLDGLSNYEEFVSNTDPQDPLSYLKVDSISNAGAGIRIEFRAAPQRTYTVEYKDDLAFPPWSTLEDVAAGPVPRIVTLVDPAGNAHRYYRLITPRQPYR